MTPDWTIPLATLVFTIISSVFVAWFRLNQNISSVKTFVYDKMENVKEAILNKLEYHERHDDQRFSQVTNDIWALRLRIFKEREQCPEDDHLNKKS